ncbi:hypothetical protein PISMIDRAFT_407579 [Pisolithus microcarpus 441]|uniref:Uncharacterized protein n=1 Tax=Pisolithus microcarpus 441 TaxID=765257 RepID=A0A0C9ZEP7_9AGAM|nr:hypothetical protein PISMIDRAFT_407579 [Pisolithus microcarpus 441]
MLPANYCLLYPCVSGGVGGVRKFDLALKHEVADPSFRQLPALMLPINGWQWDIDWATTVYRYFGEARWGLLGQLLPHSGQ